MKTYSEFGKFLSKLMINSGISKGELCKDMCYSPSQLSQALRGTQRLSDKSMSSLNKSLYNLCPFYDDSHSKTLNELNILNGANYPFDLINCDIELLTLIMRIEMLSTGDGIDNDLISAIHDVISEYIISSAEGKQND